MDPETSLADLRGRLSRARSVTILTGAGVSADSGVPTFRGDDGLWRTWRAEDLATLEAFQRDPLLVWQWYDWRRSLLADKQPNPAHHALAELERRVPEWLLVTQNVDGLHQAAGSQRVVELHGNLWRLRCTGCGRVTEVRTSPLRLPPCCPECGDLQRPDVVWFGEALPARALAAAEAALASCDLMLVIGTSGMVWPAAGFARIARSHGAFVAELNLEPTPQSDDVDLSVQGRASEIVPRLLD